MSTAAGLVIAGGLVAGDQSTSAAYRLDTVTGRTTPLPSLPVAVHDVGGAVVSGVPEVIGGGNATEQDVVQAARPDGTWRIAGRLPSPRSDLVATTVGGRVFVSGGYDGTSPALSNILVGSPSGGFQVFGRLRTAVRYPAVAASNGALWVFGGERNGVEVSSIQRVDLGTGRSRVAARLPHALGHASAVAVGGRILLVGGRTGGSRVSAAMWWFDPAALTLSRAGVLPTPLADSAVVLVHGDVFLVGGETPDLSNRVLRLTFLPRAT